ncbi:MAG: hypothetical protein AAFW68_10650, partial [Pseudomonadota bacterium]
MNAARWFAGFVLIACLAMAPVMAQPIAAAPPSPPELGRENAASPRILSDADAALYSEIFALQEEGRWVEADRKIATLENDILLGYVQYQRYMHPTAYRSSFNELKRWMAYYADHPEADKIYALARKRQPRGQSSPLRPIPRQWRSAPEKDLHPDLLADYDRTGRRNVRRIEGRVRYLSNKERALTAKKEIDGHLKRGRITERQYDRMRSWVAASLYYQGYVDAAEEMADSAATRNGDSAVLAYWIAGLIKYRKGDVAAAHDLFNAMAAVPYQEDTLRSAAGFWAARSALAAGRPENVTPNLEIASAFPFTFYGQLALAQLGRAYDYNWTAPQLTNASLKALFEADARIKRAIALKEAGKANEADLELRWANGAIEDELTPALLALAIELDLPAAQIDVALSVDNPALQAGLFPIPH